jgi:polyisoprenoid-binding protein YceI
MKITSDHGIQSLLATALLLAVPAGLRAQNATAHFISQTTNTTVAIQGTSTIHDWEMKGQLIGGFVDFPAGISFDLGQTTLPGLKDGNLPASVTARIPTKSVHSEAEIKADVMDNLMRDAMRETNFHVIEYHLAELKLRQPHAAGQPFVFDSKGELAIGGVTNKVAFPVSIVPLDKNKIVISGTNGLKMTDYKIEPPAPNIGLGLMKCGDAVKIIFNWTLIQNAPRQP